MVSNLEQLKDICKNNPIDYNDLSDKLYKKIVYKEEIYDYNFIITARGRQNFSKPLFSSVIKATKEVDKKIQLTLLEHSNLKEHEKNCDDLGINYLYFNSKGGVFNKCLSYNLSVINTKPSKWYVFHDLDCLVQKDFFKNLLENTTENTKAIQTFHKRRVLYLNDFLTDLIIREELDVNDLKENSEGVSLPQYFGAPGGSISVESEIFFEVGGYDPEFFHSYAPEDAFFWEKLSTLTNIKLCENPHNELYHMNHPILHHSNPNFSYMSSIHNKYKGLVNNKKIEFLQYKKNLYGKS